MLESENDRSFSQSTLQQATQQRLYHDNESAIGQREREIEDIAQGIIELANIFQELQTMIIDQGSMLDRIDYNVEKMGTDVREAHKELNIATNYQKRSLKRKVMLLLILVILGMFILLFLKFTSRSATPNTPAPPPPPPATPPDIDDDPSLGLDGPDRLLTKRESSSTSLPLRRNWRRRRRIFDHVASLHPV
jgi:syntaxin 16